MYNYESLRNYALWYYFRYFPSKNKLNQKLLEKWKDLELSKKIILSLENIIDEKSVLIDKINLLLLRNKNYNYILTNLMQKWFEKEMIIFELENKFDANNKSLLNRNSIYIKVQNYKSKNKSISYIKQKLIQREFDKEIVENAIYEIFWEGEEESIKKEIEKLSKKYDKQKIIQKLIAKWFKYDEIKNYDKT